MKSKTPKIKILIVDDHPVLRRGIIRGLSFVEERFLCDIEEAGTGKEAIEKCEKSIFDLIIMDYSMPVMNGAETTISILKHQPEVKVLAFSNYDEHGVIVEMLEAGVKGFLLKTIGPLELWDAMEKVLKGEFVFSEELSLPSVYADNGVITRKKDVGVVLNKYPEATTKIKKHKIVLEKCLFNVAEGNGKIMLTLADILFVTTDKIDRRNKVVYMKDQKHHTLTNYTLEYLLKLSPLLIQVNKSELVSVHAIKEVLPDVITLHVLNAFNKEKQITLSRVYKENVWKYFR